ncbi:MAG: hypothetical protein ABI622_02590 [Chloroflexota bacterium]
MAWLLLVAGIVLVGAPFTQRAPALAEADPPRYAHAVDDARAAVDGASHALDEAAAALATAIDATRTASASAFSGSAIDAAAFAEAGRLARAAAAPLDEARAALARAAGRCAALAISVRQLTASSARATSAGDAITDSADAARGFLGLRQDTSLVLDELAAAAGALGAGDHGAAFEAADAAGAAMVRIEPYAASLPALRLWLETAGDLLATVDEAASALRDGDAAAAAAAQTRLRDAAGEAAVADRALALAISEGASRVLGSPLQQLAELSRDVADAQDGLDRVDAGLLALPTPGEAP